MQENSTDVLSHFIYLDKIETTYTHFNKFSNMNP